MARQSASSRRSAKKPKAKKAKVARKPRRAARRPAPASRAAERVGLLAREQTVPADAIALLTQDHREAENLFEQFAQTDDPEMRQQLARKICFALTVHTTVEEQSFYPMARELLEEDPGAVDLLDEAEVEHAAAKTLIAEIEAMTPRDLLFDAKVKVLGEYVMHHVREEETHLFPKLREAGLDPYPAGADLAELKVVLLLGHRAMLDLPSAGKRRPRTRRTSRRR